MVWPCIILGCGYRDVKLNDTPPDYPEPPNAIVCLECGNRTNANYRRDDYYFNICCINCCRISKGKPYLSCAVCHSSFGDVGTSVCEQCRTAYPNQFLCCPHCGKHNTV